MVIKLVTLVLGSNRFIDTNGLIQVKGKELMRIEIVPYRGGFRPLITAEIRDQAGILVGRVHRSNSFAYIHPEYGQEIETRRGEVRHLALRRFRDGLKVFDLMFKPPDEVELNGVFYIEGLDFPIIATPEYLDINTNKFIKNTIAKNGAGIIIDEDLNIAL